MNLDKQLLFKDIEHIQSEIEKYSTSELTEILNKLRKQIDTMANKLNDEYKSDYKNVELKYQLIANSTLKFMKSIKYMFYKYEYLILII